MKMTLLEIVQNILSAMDSDEVNSIGDTIESVQVAEVVRETFFELFSNRDIPEHKQLIQLTGLADTTRPNYMVIPDTPSVKQIFWIKYNNQQVVTTDYRDVNFLTVEDFLNYIYKRANQSSNMIQVPDIATGTNLLILSNQQPFFWTTFDNKHICFDAYDSAIDSTLQASKSLCFGQIIPAFNLTDTFIPSIDDHEFPLLLAEAKSVCFINQKQAASQKEEQRSRRQLTRSSKQMWRGTQQKPYDRLPNFGRKPR